MLPDTIKLVLELDKTIHEPARLSILSCLYFVEQADFVFLQNETEMTGGNLSSHIAKLQKSGYVKVEKIFEDTRPRTLVSLSEKGIFAFENYLEKLRKYLSIFSMK